MAQVVWDHSKTPRVEYGVDRCVIYPENSPGVPWSGIVSINESKTDGHSTSIVVDGVTNHHLNALQRSILNVESVDYPKELNLALGAHYAAPGFLLTNQQKKHFGMCYRTHVNDDFYKIHIIYDAVITRSNALTKTIDSESSLETYTWTIDTLPTQYPGQKPTSQFIFVSDLVSKELLQSLETILYGSVEHDPRLPTLFELYNIFGMWFPLKIYYFENGLLPMVPEYGDLTKTVMEGVLTTVPNTRLVASDIPNLFRLEN